MVVLLLLEVWVGPPLRGFRREWEDGKSLGVARHRHRPCIGQGWRLATAWWHWWCSLAVRSRICASVGGALCAVRCPRKQGSSGDEGLRRSIRVARGSAPPPPQRQQPQQQEQPLSLSRLSEGVVALVVFVGGALAYLRERRRRTVRRPVPSQARQQRRRGLRRSIRVARGSRSGSSRSSRSSPCRCLGCRCLGSIGRSEHREQPTRAMGRGCGRCAEVKERWRREPASHLLHHTTQRQRRHSAQLHPCSWGVKQKTPHVSTTKIASLVFQECCLPSALA